MAGFIITNISRETISLKTGYDISIISFEADSPGDLVDGYRLIARKEGDYELIVQKATIWPANDLFPDDDLFPIDFIYEDGQIGTITLRASDLDFGDGEYQMELQARLFSNGGGW